MRLQQAAFLATVGLLACSTTGVSSSTDGTVPAPEAACAPGTRPASDGACVEVGPTSIPTGFLPATWGFRPILPETSCSGATRAALGQTECVPLDDCTEPFSRRDATRVVRASGAPVAGATVHKTLGEALEAADSGETIVIDDGEYELPASFVKDVELVGHCATKTKLHGEVFGIYADDSVVIRVASASITGSSKAAVVASGRSNVTLEHVLVAGIANGIQAGNGASVTVKESVVVGPAKSPRAGVSLSGAYASYGGKLSISDSEIRGFQCAVFGQSIKSRVDVTRSVLHEQRSLGIANEALSLVAAMFGAKVTIDGSHVEAGPGRVAIAGAQGGGGVDDPTSPGNPSARLTIKNSTLYQTGERRSEESAVDVIQGASFELENARIFHDSFAAVSVVDGSTGKLEDVVIENETNTTAERVGIAVDLRGTVDAARVAIIRPGHLGIFVNRDSSLTMRSSLILGEHELGIADPTMFNGAGQAVSVNDRSHATLIDTAFIGNEGSALFSNAGTIELEGALVSQTVASAHGPYTAAITGVDATFVIRDSELRQNQRGLSLRGGGVLLRDSLVSDSHEAVRLDGIDFVETSEAEDVVEASKLVSSRSVFERNVVRVVRKSLTDE